MTTPAVSVIIPTYNSGHLVGEAVASALVQTVPPAEVIVVDDGSSDGTEGRLAAYRGRVRYLYQPNQGVAAARNLGLRHATGDLVAFLDADDVWHPRKTELQLQVFARDPGLALLGTGTFDWPGTGYPVIGPARAWVVPVPWDDLAVKNRFTTSSVLARRDALLAAGLFDTELHGPEDHDLWLRVAEGGEAANLPLPLTGYRTVPGSLGSRPASMQAGMEQILHKINARGRWQGRRLLRRKAHSYVHYSCAYLHGAAGDPAAALANALRSFAWYPLPYRRDEVRMPLARARLFARMLGLWARPARTAQPAPAGVRVQPA